MVGSMVYLIQRMGYCSTLLRKMGYKVVRCDKDLIEKLKGIYIHIEY